jgi:phage-related protein
MMKGLGSGVFEILEDSRDGTFRVAYTVKYLDRIYVLHAFQKKSKSGIKMPLEDIDLIKKRLKLIKEMENE